MGAQKPDVVLVLDDHRGICIPRDFAECVDRARVTGVSEDDYADLANPDSDAYWDTWSTVCDNAVLTGTDGVVYRLYQDGALWLVPDGMELSDSGEWHWPVPSSEVE